MTELKKVGIGPKFSLRVAGNDPSDSNLQIDQMADQTSVAYPRSCSIEACTSAYKRAGVDATITTLSELGVQNAVVDATTLSELGIAPSNRKESSLGLRLLGPEDYQLILRKYAERFSTSLIDDLSPRGDHLHMCGILSVKQVLSLIWSITTPAMLRRFGAAS